MDRGVRPARRDRRTGVRFGGWSGRRGTTDIESRVEATGLICVWLGCRSLYGFVKRSHPLPNQTRFREAAFGIGQLLVGAAQLVTVDAARPRWSCSPSRVWWRTEIVIVGSLQGLDAANVSVCRRRPGLGSVECGNGGATFQGGEDHEVSGGRSLAREAGHSRTTMIKSP